VRCRQDRQRDRGNIGRASPGNDLPHYDQG
jgi:hypothetical protein